MTGAPDGRRREEAAPHGAASTRTDANRIHRERTPLIIEAGDGADQHQRAADELLRAIALVERAGGTDARERLVLELARRRALEHLDDAQRAHEIEEHFTLEVRT